jgi:uncharacterized coiled-coil DUF342 family protein
MEVSVPEETRREERELRRRLDELEPQIRNLRTKRQELIQELLRLSDEQRRLSEQQNPQQARLEGLHEEHRAIGREVARVRSALDSAHQRRDESLARLRSLRAQMPKTGRMQLDRARREIVRLELEQQTRALTLDDENALIARLRQLKKDLTSAEASAGATAQTLEEIKATEAEFEKARTDVDRLRKEFDRLRAERDQRMDTMKGELVSVGQLVARIRETARARAAIRDQLDEVGHALRELDREFDVVRQRLRDRRADTRRAAPERPRSPRRPVDESEALDRTADDKIRRLLKQGHITLGG